jgi:UDP-glucose 4-epimerase
MATEPLSPYAVAKLSGELYAAVFHRLYHLETVSLRYFNVFGPRQDPSSPYSGVVSRFIESVATDVRPVIHGDGGQTRDFTYVENVARANFAACHRPEAAGRFYNIGCGARVSVLELWNRIAELSGSKLQPTFVATRSGDVPHSLADISRARRDLGYEPAVDFGEGLRRTLDYYGILARAS